MFLLLKMFSCFLELVEDYVLRKKPVSAFHTLKPFPFLSWLHVQTFDQTSVHKHCSLCVFVDHFIGNKLFLLSWKGDDL